MKDLDKVYAENLATEYSKKENSKLVQLKKLDRKAKLPGAIFGYTFGILGISAIGIGYCLATHVFGPATTVLFVLGIIIRVVGIFMMSINKFLSDKILKKSKEKYAYEIISLASEVSKEE